MPDAQKLVLFIVTALVVLVTPGPAVFYIVARSLGDGLKTGIASAVGMTLGGLVHVAVLVAGFAAFVADSPGAQRNIQLAGSVFLVYLGLRRLPRRADETPAGDATPGAGTATERSAILDAAIVNLLNPKAIVFLLAFLPQFATGDTPRALQSQLIFFGLVFVSLGLATDMAYAIAASRLRRRVLAQPQRMQVMQRVSGGAIALLGVAGIVNYFATAA